MNQYSDCELVLKGDPFNYHIIQNLDILTLYNLRLTCKHYLNITISLIKQKIISEMEDRLRKVLGHTYNEFMDIFKEAKAVISGSFIIQCVLNEYWDSDIDIYISYFNANFYKDIVGKMRQLLAITMTELYKTKNNYLSRDLLIRNVYTYQNPNVRYKIQIITIEAKPDYLSMSNYVKEKADFDICKNVYYVDEDKSFLNINTIDNILSKKATFSYFAGFRASFQRYLKYSNRGFIFKNVSYDQDLSDELNDYISHIKIPASYKLKKQTTANELYNCLCYSIKKTIIPVDNHCAKDCIIKSYDEYLPHTHDNNQHEGDTRSLIYVYV